jgi:hypothetical protein
MHACSLYNRLPLGKNEVGLIDRGNMNINSQVAFFHPVRQVVFSGTIIDIFYKFLNTNKQADEGKKRLLTKHAKVAYMDGKMKMVTIVDSGNIIPFEA